MANKRILDSTIRSSIAGKPSPVAPIAFTVQHAVPEPLAILLHSRTPNWTKPVIHSVQHHIIREEIRVSLPGAKVSSKNNLPKAYHQIPMASKDSENSNRNAFQPLRVPADAFWPEECHADISAFHS